MVDISYTTLVLNGLKHAKAPVRSIYLTESHVFVTSLTGNLKKDGNNSDAWMQIDTKYIISICYLFPCFMGYNYSTVSTSH